MHNRRSSLTRNTRETLSLSRAAAKKLARRRSQRPIIVHATLERRAQLLYIPEKRRAQACARKKFASREVRCLEAGNFESLAMPRRPSLRITIGLTRACRVYFDLDFDTHSAGSPSIVPYYRVLDVSLAYDSICRGEHSGGPYIWRRRRGTTRGTMH